MQFFGASTDKAKSRATGRFFFWQRAGASEFDAYKTRSFKEKYTRSGQFELIDLRS